MNDCGHICCHIPLNAYHAHSEQPERCTRCRAEAPTEELEVNELEYMNRDVAHIVSAVVTRMAPDIPTLPEGAALTELVRTQAVDVYLGSLDDPRLMGMGFRERRTILAGRIGLALAFPETVGTARADGAFRAR